MVWMKYNNSFTSDKISRRLERAETLVKRAFEEVIRSSVCKAQNSLLMSLVVT